MRPFAVPRPRLAAATLILVASLAYAQAPKIVEYGSPAAPTSRMEADGSIVTDWGRLGLTVSGAGVSGEGPTEISAVKLDGVIPAAVARSVRGPVALTTTAFRAPTYPAGTDVVTVSLADRSGKGAAVRLTINAPDGSVTTPTTLRMGGRVIVAFPQRVSVEERTRDWGYADDASSLPGWASPAVDCDPAFRNIRAGMEGVPIVYKLNVAANSKPTVVLGFCESHWESPGTRPFVCSVEGSDPVKVDPLARWGRHQPGALLFEARDANGDGKLDVSVLPGIGAPDPNPILNVLWVFPEGAKPNLEQVIAGRMNTLATHYVDVGGQKDQSLYLPSPAQFDVAIPAGGTRELTFLLGAAGGSAPMPGKTGWTRATLRKAARDVNRDWKSR